MITVIKQSNPIAQKNYTCNACEWVLNGGYFQDIGLTFKEYCEIIKAKWKEKNKYSI